MLGYSFLDVVDLNRSWPESGCSTLAHSGPLRISSPPRPMRAVTVRPIVQMHPAGLSGNSNLIPESAAIGGASWEPRLRRTGNRITQSRSGIASATLFFGPGENPREDWLSEFCFASGSFLEMGGRQPHLCEPSLRPAQNAADHVRGNAEFLCHFAGRMRFTAEPEVQTDYLFPVVGSRSLRALICDLDQCTPELQNTSSG
jgi:hypothetical protein